MAENGCLVVACQPVTRRLQIQTRLRALCALLALILGYASVPAALALQETDVCSMACCTREGHCCCSPRHSRVRGNGDQQRASLNGDSTMSAPCPESCAVPGSSSSISLRDITGPRSNSLLFSNAAPAHSSRLIFSKAEAVLDNSSSRGPPSLNSDQI